MLLPSTLHLQVNFCVANSTAGTFRTYSKLPWTAHESRQKNNDHVIVVLHPPRNGNHRNYSPQRNFSDSSEQEKDYEPMHMDMNEWLAWAALACLILL